MTAIAIWLGYTAGKLLDPLVWVLGALVGAGSRRSWHLIVGGAISAALYCILVLIRNDLPGVDPRLPLQFLAVSTGTTLLGALLFAVRSLLRRTNSAS